MSAETDPDLPEDGSVVVRTLRGSVLDLRRTDRHPHPYRVIIVDDQGVQHALTIALPANAPLPLSQGMVVRAYHVARRIPGADRTTAALSISDGKGRKILAFQAAGLLPDSEVPPTLRVVGKRRVSYVDAGRDRLCYKVVEHRMVEIQPGQRKVLTAPGGAVELTLGGDPYRVILVDNAHEIGGECTDYKLDGLVWVAVRLPEPAVPAPTPGAR